MQICTSSISQAISPVVRHLHLYDQQECLDENIENGQWLDLLRPFNGVEGLYYLSREITHYIAHALQELVGERVTEVLPGLQSLSWSFTNRRMSLGSSLLPDSSPVSL
jgi:hypothetical protein